MKARSSLDEIITSSNEVFTDFESDMAVGLGQLGNPIGKTAETNHTAKHAVGSYILTLLLQVKKTALSDIACIVVMLYTRLDCKD